MKEDLLARMEAKMDSRQEEMKAQLGSLTSRINANREEMNTRMDATEEKIDAWIIEMKDGRKKEMMACQGTKEACLDNKEPNLEDMQSRTKHRKVPKENATVKSSGALKKQHRDWNLVAECRGKPKEWTQGNCGSQNKLAAGRKMAHCTRVARRKVHVIRKNQTRDKARQGTSRGRTFGRRHQPKPEHKNGTRNKGLRPQLRSKREFNKTLRETLGLEFVK